MKLNPDSSFPDKVVKSTRQVTYTVTLEIDGVDTNIDQHVKMIRIKRTAGNAKLATFTAALATEVDVTLFPVDLYLGTNPYRKRLKIWIGFEGSEVKMFEGVVQSITRRAITDVTLVALDDALALSRVYVETPGIFNANSNVLVKEILEHAGVSSRAGSPSELIFALDFDGKSRLAVVSAKKESADVDDNGVNLSTIEPHRYYDFDGKKYSYGTSTRSQMMILQPMTIVQYSDNPNVLNGMTIDAKKTNVSDNAVSKSYVPVASGYGGGAVINPSVVYFPAGWNGAKYWMAVTPRPKNTFTDTEKNMWRWNGYTRALSEALMYGDKGDPTIVVGDNGTSWSTPGFSNPIYPRPTYGSNTTVHRKNEHGKMVHYTMQAGSPRLGYVNCDATLVYDTTNGRLYCVWRLIAGTSEYWYYRYTTNGTSWSTTTRWRSGVIGSISNPTFCPLGSEFRVWWVNKTMNPNGVFTAKVDYIGGTLHNIQQCHMNGLPSTKDVMRVAAMPDPGGTGWVGCITRCNRGTNMVGPMIQVGTSVDGHTWSLGNSVVNKSTGGWDNHEIFSGCFVADVDDLTGHIADVWYTACNTNETHGLGKTDLYQDKVAWEGATSSKASKGPIIYGPFFANKMIDGRTAARYTEIWPQSNTDNTEHVVTFGGWFSRRGVWNSTLKDWVDTGIKWGTTTPQFMFMEAHFGTKCKVEFGKNGTNLVATCWTWTGAVWTGTAQVVKSMSGVTWGKDEEHFVACSVRMLWRAGQTYPDVALTLNVDGTLTDGSWQQGNAEAALFRRSGLTQVGICAVSSSGIHAAMYDNAFPGLSYNNLFVKYCGSTRAYTPTAAEYQLEPGLNKIRAGAYRGSNPWEELKIIAEAELGAFVYTEEGILRFYNRQHYNLGTAAQSVMTINSTQHLKDCVTVQDVGDIRNIVRVRVKSQDLGIARDIWKLDDPLIIPAQKTVTIEFEASGVLEACDTNASVTINYGGSRYRAAYVLGVTGEGPRINKNGIDDSRGGAESYISIQILPNGRGGTINITNNSTRDIVMYDGNGNPYLYIWGRAYHEERFSSADSPVVEVVDVNSVAAYGQNEYEVNLDYMTDATVAEALGQYLVMRYGTAPLKVEDIKTVGDPRLEIGDKVRLVYSVLGLNHEFWVESITDTVGPETGYEQDIDVAIADTADWFILDSSLLGSDANPAHRLIY